ncbi:hypothetical protein PENTCL1PPCAC_12458, partial [Pristionchus entomophagus]
IGECTEAFDKAGILQNHLRVFHKVKPFHCSICGKMFGKFMELNRHKRVHDLTEVGREKTTEPKFPCSLCSFVARSESGLGIHLTCRHSEELLHKCTIGECTERFANVSQLKQHLREMHKLKPFQCSICGEMFDWFKELEEHKKERHIFEKEFPCGLCSFVAVNQTGLRNHMKNRHSGAQDSDCSESFALPSGLVNHKRVFHKLKPYHCSICGEMFYKL